MLLWCSMLLWCYLSPSCPFPKQLQETCVQHQDTFLNAHQCVAKKAACSRRPHCPLFNASKLGAQGLAPSVLYQGQPFLARLVAKGLLFHHPFPRKGFVCLFQGIVQAFALVCVATLPCCLHSSSLSSNASF